MLNRRVILLAAGLAVALCASPARAQDRLKTVATFSILGDLVKNVGGDRVDVAVLVGPNGDAHVYSPTPGDARQLAEAKIVFINGLGFEGWIARLVKSSATAARTVVVSKGISAREADDVGHGHHDHAKDPHAWQSVANAKVYVANIRDALVAADPANRAFYEANATAYRDRLDALEQEVKAAIAQIPPERRRIITSHDAFGYFAAAYGMTFLAPEGVSTDSQPSAIDVARIITQVRLQKIPAIFMENVSDPRLMQQIARETGAKIGGKLYSDALSDSAGPAATYIDMMRNNIRAFTAALKG